MPKRIRFKHSLRYRVALGFALFGGLVSLLLAIVLYLASLDLEERLIDETLAAELDDYVARRSRNPNSLPQSTATIHTYVIGPGGAPIPIPPEVQALAPGVHQLRFNDIPYRAMVVERSPDRYFILYNETSLRRREQGFLLFLAGGVLVMSVIAAALGLWLTGRVIAPVASLARRVRGLRPEHQAEPLAQYFPHDEVGELAASFDHYMERLQAFIERERSFTGDASHELRTPLAVIQGAAEVLLIEPGLSDAARDRVQRIARACSEMGELTAALLGLAREGEGTLPTGGSCSVEEVLRDVVDKLGHLLKAKPITVTVEVRAQPQLQAERAMLAIVLGNIVRNAFTYTEQGHIHLVLEQEELWVEDTGTGIRPDEMERVFHRYYRGAGSAGSGIGLSLVKRICDRHGWQVQLAGRAGGGTVIRLLFPTGSLAH